MSLINIVLLAAVLLATVSASQFENVSPFENSNARIVGGINARDVEFPHICSIELIRAILPSQHVGAGNILNRRWILTAASVITPPPLFARYEITCGRVNLALPFEVTEQRVRINSVINHPSYNGTYFSANDIALIELTSELHYSPQVQPIGLPANAAVPTGIASLIGWGGTDDAWIGQSFGHLQFARVPILSQANCAPFVERYVSPSNTHFCTGPMTGGLSPCNEDRGSSLVQTVGVNQVVIGLVSLPQGCGWANYPGLYTRVSAFVPWINSIVV